MKIIILAGKGESTKYIYNGIKDQIIIDSVLVTDSISSKEIIKNRIKKLGIVNVVNQLVFQLLVISVLKFLSKHQIEKRKNELGLISNNISGSGLIDVGMVNSKKCIETIQLINPDIIIVNGTSIISKKVLESTKAIFINTHVGITPQYRGVHGGYWALRNRDHENFGVTIHKVDTGIDTGDIIYQSTCSVSPKDNFLTYPLYQYALAIPLLINAISDIKNNNLKLYTKEKGQSKLYYHPTFTSYIKGWLKDGIK